MVESVPWSTAIRRAEEKFHHTKIWILIQVVGKNYWNTRAEDREPGVRAYKDTHEHFRNQTKIVRETLIRELGLRRSDIQLHTYIHADGEEGTLPVDYEALYKTFDEVDDLRVDLHSAGR